MNTSTSTTNITISQEQYKQFCDNVNYIRDKYPTYTEGQVLHNAIYMMDTHVADALHSVNPFYNDANIEEFIFTLADSIKTNGNA